MLKITTKTEKETLALAKEYAKTLKGGEIIGLLGNLGAGKTTFTKGLAAGLGIKKTITSPTFVFMKVYPAKTKAIKMLVHIDAYRIKTAADIAAIGALEYFQRPDAVTIIEWADKIKKLLPKKARLIKFKNIKETKRTLVF